MTNNESSDGEFYLERVTKNSNSDNTPNDVLYSILKIDNKQFLLQTTTVTSVNNPGQDTLD